MREIPKKNYIILGVMTIFVVSLVLGLSLLYKDINNKTYISPLKEHVNEIKYDDIDDFIIENPNIVLYIKDSKVDNMKIEKEIRDIVVENNIQQNIVYIEKNKKVKEKYKLDNNSPVFIIYKDGKEYAKLSENEYNIEQIKKFLTKNGVIEND